MRRVLVIDDHVPSRDNLKRALAASGCQVVGEGTTGKGAEQLASATVPDVVLMAVGLSDLDGIRAARRIMQSRPVPVILVSSHYDTETVERAKRAGVMGYLLKPLRDGELLPTIEIAVSQFREFVTLRKENENLKKTLEARKIIERAKGILMKSKGLSEAEAFSLIQKKSMDLRKPMGEIAQAVIVSEELSKTKSD
jgi:AmiR/NasT family two-component response regulator